MEELKTDYKHYRESSIGKALEDALDDLVEDAKLTPAQAVSALLQFDVQINKHLSQLPEVQARITGDMQSYRNAENVWNWNLTNAELSFQGPAGGQTDEVTATAINMVATDAFPGRVIQRGGRKKKKAGANAAKVSKEKKAKTESVKKEQQKKK